jgi:integrase
LWYLWKPFRKVQPLAAAVEGQDPLDRKPPTLSEFSMKFLDWVETARLEPKTRRYYRNGWRLLKEAKLKGKQHGIMGMRIDRISAEYAEALEFPHSPSNGNNALRTLRRALNQAGELKLIREVPDFRLFKEEGRARRLDDEAERKLVKVAEQPLKDIIVLMRDTGMRNVRELYRMRVENIDWASNVYFNPNSKTEKGRRFIPLSDRSVELLKARSAGRTEGWVFASRYRGKHIGEAFVNRQWVKARKAAKLPEDLVLYCARHDYGTFALEQTGNLAVVMRSMGHADLNTAMKYQHPELRQLQAALNSRHVLRHSPETDNV